MSFNRNLYDDCAFKKRITESKSPGNYMLFPGKFYNQNQARISKGIVAGNEVSLTKNNLVDLESDLRGQTRILSDCPSKKYQPRCNWCRNCDEGLPCGCIDCQEELIDLQTKDMFHYNDVAMPDKIPSYKCPQPYQ
tara:strand:- start:1281 stop:1688 length:408 start_codon:yes stop_codon:yes gene_type:complete